MKKTFVFIFTIYFLLCALGLFLYFFTQNQPSADEKKEISHLALATRYAPVIYQYAQSNQDFITAVDFDHDWIGNNNWENQPSGDLSAYVYYALIETKTHWFITYALFHPRDYSAFGCDTMPQDCHETI